jgi:hypothetical protein
MIPSQIKPETAQQMEQVIDRYFGNIDPKTVVLDE